MMPLQLFKCLSDNTRLQSVLLIYHFKEACVCDLIAALELDQPKVSRHLAELRRCGILQDERRGKWVYYRLHQDLPEWALDVIRLAADNNQSYFSAAIDKLHQYRQQGPGCQLRKINQRSVMKILYICTHNRCRSILSEAITNHVAGDKISARSAGSQPSGVVHPLSLQYLTEAGVPTEGLTSQSWDEFEEFAPDVVVTVCDSAAGESCPVWFGKSVKVHWGLSDPSKVEGSDEQKAAAFRASISEITERVNKLVPVAEKSTSPAELKAALAALGAQ